MFNSLVKVTPPPTEKEQQDPDVQFRQELARNQLMLMKLLPIARIELAADEREVVQTYQMASLVLGPAASAPMVCSHDCPSAFKTTCPLAQMGKEPLGQRCPFEQQYVSERFIGWLNELGRTLDDLLESERSAITTLVTLDLQERRCAAILADAQNAQLTSRSVTDVDVNTGTPIAWEDVIHANAERLDQLIDKRRMILKDLELTREMVTKRQKALGQLKDQKGSRFASRQSDVTDKVRRALRGESQIVDIR